MLAPKKKKGQAGFVIVVEQRHAVWVLSVVFFFVKVAVTVAASLTPPDEGDDSFPTSSQ